MWFPYGDDTTLDIVEWNDKADGSGKAYSISEVYYLKPESDMELYGQWGEYVLVKFYSGTEGYIFKHYDALEDKTQYQTRYMLSAPKDRKFIISDVFDDPQAFEGNNLVFDGWFTDQSYDEKYRLGDTAVFTEDTEVYAKWKEDNKSDIGEAVVSGVVDKTYNGESHEQELVVKYNGTTLEEGKDYTVNYENNKEPGTAKITISGTGEKFTGTQEVSFSIVDPCGPKLPDKLTGLLKASDGKTYCYKDGVFQKNYTGLYEKSENVYYGLMNGVWVENWNGLYLHSKNGKYYYLQNGVWKRGYVGLYVHSINGKTYYLNNGIWNRDYTGLYQHSVNQKYYYLKNGIWQKGYDGLYVHSKNKWTYYLRNGVWNRVTEWYKHSSNGLTYYIETGLWRGKYKDQKGVQKQSKNVVVP